jgi:hypothetical protein
VNRWMRWSSPALLVAFVVALVVAACGELPGGKDAQQASGAPRAAKATENLVQADVCLDTDPECTPTGAHGKHGSFNCLVCHAKGGRLSFTSSGPNALAYRAGSPAPSFDAAAKTCSNVACHGVPPGTFSYYFPGNEDNDGDGFPDAELKTVNYGGTLAASTPGWYTTGNACTACHGNPPANGSDGSNAWHSGFHANNQNVGAIGPNACELCHNSTEVPFGTWIPVAFSGVAADGHVRGISINPAAASQHANGTATVRAKFVSQCFGCH